MAADSDEKSGETSVATEASSSTEPARDESAKPVGAREPRRREGHVGHALRSVYQQTVNEDIPDEMLKLLGKLT